jgi:hypothetical protein
MGRTGQPKITTNRVGICGSLCLELRDLRVSPSFSALAAIKKRAFEDRIAAAGRSAVNSVAGGREQLGQD